MKQRVAIGMVLCFILAVLPSAAAAAASVPVSTTRPAVSGTAGVNGTLTTTKGSWTNSPTKYAYAWLHCASDGTACAVISGATKATYLVVSADAGKRLESRVIASNASGPSAAAYSNLTTVVGYPPGNLSVPTVSGSPVIGNALTAGRGSWSQTPTAYAYRWRRCDSGGAACVTITGATSSTYVVGEIDRGSSLRVQVIATNTSGSSTATSAPTAAVSGPAVPVRPLSEVVNDDLAFASQQLAATATATPTGRYPQTTGPTGAWVTTAPSGWTSGFLPGSLWLTFERTGDTSWRDRAESVEAGLAAQQYNTSTHDVGFMMFTSYGNAYRLTGNDTFRQIVVQTAASLATRYNAVVGATKSWDSSDSSECKVIVDNMMNIELLFWAATHGGNAAWADMAHTHALTTARNHVRADGSTYQLVVFDANTGAVRTRSTISSIPVGDTWSRGQAWAVHGFTMAYRETRDPVLLQTAERVADFFVGHLPADGVPYVSFGPTQTTGQRDSSAGAVGASGLIELSQLEPDAAKAQRYADTAVAIIRSLSSPVYLAQGTASHAILLKGAYSAVPTTDIELGTSWGDYYFLEALQRLHEVGLA